MYACKKTRKEKFSGPGATSAAATHAVVGAPGLEQLLSGSGRLKQVGITHVVAGAATGVRQRTSAIAGRLSADRHCQLLQPTYRNISETPSPVLCCPLASHSEYTVCCQSPRGKRCKPQCSQHTQVGCPTP